MLKDRGFILLRVQCNLGFMTVTNQCPIVLLWEEIFNYNPIKILDLVGLGCLHGAIADKNYVRSGRFELSCGNWIQWPA